MEVAAVVAAAVASRFLASNLSHGFGDDGGGGGGGCCCCCGAGADVSEAAESPASRQAN